MSETTEELLTVDELSKIIKIKKNTLYRMALDRKLPSIKIGKIRRFRLSDVMQTLCGHEVTASQDTVDCNGHGLNTGKQDRSKP